MRTENQRHQHINSLETPHAVHTAYSGPVHDLELSHGIATSTEARSAFVAYPREHLQRAEAEFDVDRGEGESDCLPPTPNDDVLLSILIENAQVLMRNREYNLAFQILRSVQMRQPNHREALRWLAECFKEMQRFEEALKCFKALDRLYPSGESHFLLAQLLYLMGRDDEAFKKYQDAMLLLRSDSELLFEVYKNLGNILVRLGDYEGAEENYNRAFVLQPESDALLVNYGTLEVQRDNIEAALERFRTAIALAPHNDKAWVGLALVHRHMGDLELSEANLEKALDLNPSNKTALQLYVDWKALSKKYDVSVARLTAYLNQHAEDVEMSFLLARVFVESNRLQEARIELERVIAIDASYPKAVELARILDRTLREARL